MCNLWHNCTNASKRKKQTLHSLIVGFVFFGAVYVITKFFPISLCPIQNLFDVECPGCGLSRGFVSVLELDFEEAVRHHVLSIPLFCGITLYAVFAVVDICCDKNYIERIEHQCGRKYMLVAYFLILVLSVILNRLL